MKSSTPVLTRVENPSFTELERIRNQTSEHIFCVFRNVINNSLLVVTSDYQPLYQHSTGRRAIRLIEQPRQLSPYGYRPRIKGSFCMNKAHILAQLELLHSRLERHERVGQFVD